MLARKNRALQLWAKVTQSHICRWQISSRSFWTRLMARRLCKTRKVVPFAIQSSIGFRSGGPAFETVWNLTVLGYQLAAHASSRELCRAADVRHSASRPGRVYWIVATFVCIHQVQVAIAFVASERRALSPNRKACWNASWPQRLWAWERKAAWFLCRCHWIIRRFVLGVSRITAFCLLTRRLIREIDEDAENGGIHNFSKLIDNWPRLPRACWWRVAGGVLHTVSYVPDSSNSGAERGHSFCVPQQPENCSKGWRRGRRWGYKCKSRKKCDSC